MRRRHLILLGPVVAALVAAAAISAGVINNPPHLSIAPGPVTAEATGPTGATVSFSVTATDDEDDPDPTPICTPASGSNFPLGATIVSCEVTDSGGLTDSDSFGVTVQDTTDPTFGSIPADITVPELGGPGAVVAYTTPTASDAVDTSVSVGCLPASGSTFAVGTTTVTCTATDDAGNQATATFTITVIPNQPPEVDVTAPAQVEATGPTGSPVNYSVTVDDAEDSTEPNASCSPISGSTFPLGSTTINCSATDSGGKTGFGSAVVAVVDTTGPTVSVPSGATVEPTGPDGAIVNYPAATATDIVGVVTGPICSPASGSLFPIGLTVVTCTAGDAAGNVGSSSFSISVQDADAPVVTVPESRTVEANGPDGATVNYPTPTATDVIDGPLPATCSPASGALFPLGATLVTCTATDSAGLTGSAAFTVTVVDTTPPVLTVPADLGVQSSAPVPASNSAIKDFLAGATATDIVDKTVVVTNDAPATFPLGTTTVVFTAKDDAGNEARKSAVVTISTQPVAPPANADTTPPDNVRSVKAIAGNLSVAIAWRAPRAKDFHHVTITRTPGLKDAPESLVYRGRKTTFVARGLKDQVEYRFVIVAYDEAGNRAAGVAVVVFAEQQNLLVPVNGATITAPRRFAWRAVPDADYYNIQFWKDGKKLSVWPLKARYTLRRSWRFEGKLHRLVPGTWLVYVWPGFGNKAESDYGELHVDATFVVKRR